MSELDLKKYLVRENDNINLKNIDANEYNTFNGTKEKAIKKLNDINIKLEKLHQIYYSGKKHKILIIFQGMDASGKDGAIRNIFQSVNPTGVYVAHFGSPSKLELSHDFLWRVHNKVPADGELVIFNRSHYEDILIVRVQNLKPQSVWQKRFKHIIDFERLLYDEGTHIFKFFLHISKDEQRQRLQNRIDNPDKHWKIEANDFKDRELWDEYIEAYNDVLNKTSFDWAPWYIIPSNKKWYRDLIISNILVDEFTKLKMEYPKPINSYLGKVIV